MQCGLEFSQNYNYKAPHFCGHMCNMVYKMQFEQFEIDIFSNFWVFPTKPKTNFSLCFEPSFKLMS